MDTSVMITLIICVTIFLSCVTSKIFEVLEKKYDHENIIKSESEEK